MEHNLVGHGIQLNGPRVEDMLYTYNYYQQNTTHPDADFL